MGRSSWLNRLCTLNSVAPSSKCGHQFVDRAAIFSHDWPLLLKFRVRDGIVEGQVFYVARGRDAALAFEAELGIDAATAGQRFHWSSSRNLLLVNRPVIAAYTNTIIYLLADT